MKVIVTGSSGQVGSFIVDALRADDYEVVGLDRRVSTWTTLDQDLLDGIKIDGDAVVHCAAQVSVEASVDDPVMDERDNVQGTLRVLEWARQRDAQVVHFSSAAVYGTPEVVPVKEDHPLRPLSPYGVSKLASEQYGSLYRDLYGLPVTILRPFNIFSERSPPGSPYSGVITKFMERVSQGEPPVINGDGGQTRDFVHVKDVVQAVRLVLSEPGCKGGVFNVGTGHAMSIAELAEICRNLAGVEAPALSGPERKGDIRHSTADISELTKQGYRPMTDIEQDLAGLFDHAARPPEQEQ